MTERPAHDLTPGVTLARLHFEGEERIQRLRQDLGVTTFGINLIRLRPGQRGRIHAHREQEEVYVVLGGTLTLRLDGREEHVLDSGAAARVAPGVRRQLVNRSSVPLVLLALGGATRHEGRDGIAFAAWDEAAGRPPQEVPLPDDEPVA